MKMRERGKYTTKISDTSTRALGFKCSRTARRSGRMDSRCIEIINKCQSRTNLEYSWRRSFRGTVTIEMSGMGTKDSFTISKRHSRTCQEYSWHLQIRGTILIKTQFLNGIKDKGDMAQHRLRGNRADSFHMLIDKGSIVEGLTRK